MDSVKKMIPNQLTGLHKQKGTGNKTKVPMSPTKSLSDSIKPSRIPKKSHVPYWAREGTKPM
jgi:hypothetical protein